MSLGRGQSNNDGVYYLLTELCHKTAIKYTSQNQKPYKNLVMNMRSRSYEILLKKSSITVTKSDKKAVTALLSFCFVEQQRVTNVAEYKRCAGLKRIISMIRCMDFGESQDHIYNILKLLLSLSNTVKQDVAAETYKQPFSFGLLDRMLPRPPVAPFGSPKPYPYYPMYMFDLPYTLRKQGMIPDRDKSPSYSEYAVEIFDSKSMLLDNSSLQKGAVEVKTFLSPISLPSLTSTQLSPYLESAMCPERLTAPRDLVIPSSSSTDSNIKVESISSTKEVFKAKNDDLIDIWEIASQIDKDIPDDIWELASKSPPTQQRQLMASSAREVALWRRTYGGGPLAELNVISETQFIRHVMYLIIGIETNSFPFSEELNSFCVKDGLVLEFISKEHLRGYVSSLLVAGTYYRRLFKFAFNQTSDDHFHSHGLIYEASREVVRRYLLEYRLTATRIYETSCQRSQHRALPTLLQILFHIEPLKYEIETIASIYKMINSDTDAVMPQGSEFMSYLFREISLLTDKTTTHIMFNSLHTITKVYFKFIERFIFEGELDDKHNEFFIRKEKQYVNCRAKRYWDKGYYIAQTVAVPDFLRAVANCILLCGKSLRLLKLCNPSDPLVLLISSDHPSVKCCTSFEELEQQQQVLDVYRTRCLFVSGEPVTFEQILLKKEAEKKAFAEMASIKQAETMEHILAERKRLAQLIVAEKQHSLRVLEAAMEEAKAAKRRAWERDRMRGRVVAAAHRAAEQVDGAIAAGERNKIMEYYSKLNMEVERSKIHTEWKIKRLQLDQSRMKLLSAEERNLKREKLELKHKQNEEIMAMSIQSIETEPVDDNSNINTETAANNGNPLSMTESVDSLQENYNTDAQPASAEVGADSDAATRMLMLNTAGEECDNNRKFDSQGNIIDSDVTSAGVIGKYLDNVNDNNEYLQTRRDAVMNKQKVMSHEMELDQENNKRLDTETSYEVVDNENNVLTPYEEAKRNKIKVLSDEFGKPILEEKKVLNIPRTEAAKEALLNKQKVLGVEYNIPSETQQVREPVNDAQVEACRNRNKIMSSEDIHKLREGGRRESARTLNLTLDLKSASAASTETYTITPNTGTITPATFLPRLDLETPTTETGPLTSNIDLSTPHSASKTSEIGKLKSDSRFLSSDGFDFSMIVDEDTTDAEVVSGIKAEDTPNNSSWKTNDCHLNKPEKYSCINIVDGTYNLDNFDPFGVKSLKKYCKDHFCNQMDIEMAKCWYTHPATTMEEVTKRPYNNIFGPHWIDSEDEKKITCNNIATFTACLQRSVILPLTYQLEVVNNAILSHFLVNLDMYEHMNSMKDYFFLMDGEFSRSICMNLFKKLGQTLNPKDLLNFPTLHNILDKALGSSISQVPKFSENLSFIVPTAPKNLQHSSPDVLQCLSLTYCVSWPLNIILSQEALVKYDKVFHFLIKMRRVSWVLGDVFETLKLSVKLCKSQRRVLQRSPQYLAVQVYRHAMGSSVRALDSYITNTCILASWCDFENDLTKASTLDDICHCHAVYLKKVLFRCLLNNRSTPVMKLFDDIFTVILKFSRVLKSGEWIRTGTEDKFQHTEFSQLEDLFHLFEKLNKYLHKVVMKLMECGYQRHMVELLTMLNFNGYYEVEKSKDEPNTTVPSPARLLSTDKRETNSCCS